MTGKEIYKIWAPENAKWVDWVRPVPFVGIDYNLKMYKYNNFQIPKLEILDEFMVETAIIVDFPGIKSVEYGIALAKLGFRPIPIYNGTLEQENSIATTDNKNIIYGLIKGSRELKKIQIKEDAMPTFLLDSNRMNRFKVDESVFDNSWDIYAQDLPTAEYLLNNKIKKILIIGNVIQKDLKKILYKFQKKELKIFSEKEYEIPKFVIIKKPKIDKED